VVVAARAVLDLLGAARESLRVYLVKDLAEAGAAMLGKDAAVVARQMAEMCARADLVVAVTPALRDTLAERGVRSELLPHGFHSELAPVYDGASRPAEYEALPSPRLGYTGRIDARLDFEALELLADRFAHGSVVLVGPVSPLLADEAFDRLARRHNVHLLGARPREELPGYARHLDCCLMPYRDDEWLRHGSPLKLWDYLYAGPPLVGSGCAALRDYPLVSFAESPGDLPELVERALRDGAAERAERRAFALANTWDRRAEQLGEIVERALAGDGPRRSAA
jgi:glycosyltransferase involved in cell wall biosynthesis